MYRTLETMGSRLLGLFVPQVDASAAQIKRCWAQCWQCGPYGTRECRCNAKCCENGNGGFKCYCSTCP